jgi:NADH dehydrogenase
MEYGMDLTQKRPRVIIIGAGFGGLFAARQLAGKAVDVLLIDRHNYHTFTPLLYQVATSALDPGEIAYPVRPIFRDKVNMQFLLGEVSAVDPAAKTVTVDSGGQTLVESYDYLILAAGSVVDFFGNQAVQRFGIPLRTLGDAVDLRNHILRRFEEAIWESNPETREALTTIVVVGGGPTGLETAGAVAELYAHSLNAEFPQGQFKARVLLVEAIDHLLDPYPPKLQTAALEQLRSLGVEVVLSDPVVAVDENAITLKSGIRIPTRTLIWSAGIQGAPLASKLGLELEKGRRVRVKPTLEVIGMGAVYAVGDMSYLEDAQGKPYPQMIPPAQQQGTLAARNILRRTQGEVEREFVYADRGLMATIGRSRAVAWLYNRVPLRGFTAWAVWLVLHLMTLMGFRNRVQVFINWVWNYITYDRSIRIILDRNEDRA